MPTTPPAKPTKRRSDAEQQLTDQLRRIDKTRESWVAIYIRLGALQTKHRRLDYLAISQRAFIDVVRSCEGLLYILNNDDLVYLARFAPMPVLMEAIEKIRLLFAQDPLTHFDANETEHNSFYQIYKLSHQYDAFVSRIERQTEANAHNYEREKLLDRVITRPNSSAINPKQLDALESRLATIDFGSLVRQQPICQLVGERWQIISEEIYVAINDLQTTLIPQYNPREDPWLFQYLLGLLDQKMLAYLPDHPELIQRHYNINLRVNSVLSQQFLAFDELLPKHAREQITLELDKLDIYADLGSYLFARDFLRERGYRLCLDGIYHLILDYFDASKLGVHQLKLIWDSEAMDNLSRQQLEQLRAGIANQTAANVILCRCDSPQAIALGQQLGITKFQGREIDRQLASQRLRRTRKSK